MNIFSERGLREGQKTKKRRIHYEVCTGRNVTAEIRQFPAALRIQTAAGTAGTSFIMEVTTMEVVLF